jgi:hypothetical protein
LIDGRGFLILDWLSLLAESSPEFRGRGPGYYINSISLSFGYLLGGVVVGGLVAFLLTKPKEPTLAKAASRGNIEAAQKHIAAGTGVNAKDNDVTTTLDSADAGTVDLLCKHGDKNKKEQKTVGKSDDESCRSVPSLETQHSEPVSESSRQEPLMAKSSNSEADRALFDAAKAGNIEAFKQHLAASNSARSASEFDDFAIRGSCREDSDTGSECWVSSEGTDRHDSSSDLPTVFCSFLFLSPCLQRRSTVPASAESSVVVTSLSFAFTPVPAAICFWAASIFPLEAAFANVGSFGLVSRKATKPPTTTPPNR